MFCPACQSNLHDRTLLDPNLKGYACDSGHIYYTTLNEQSGGIPTANTVRSLPRSSSDVEVLKFWLTNQSARKRLPNQLALVCRRIVEIIENKHHVAKIETPFVFCLTCGDELSPYGDDNYMQGWKCKNGHEFWERGGTINYIEHGARANLSAELDDDYLPTLIEAWLSDYVWIQPYVHEQLRNVLSRFSK